MTEITDFQYYQIQNYHPRLTGRMHILPKIDDHKKHQVFFQQTYSTQVLNSKFDQQSTTNESNTFVRQSTLKPSIKLKRPQYTIVENSELSIQQKDRTISTFSLQNIKKVDFNPQVLVILSEKGFKRREKLIEETVYKRRGNRKKCILIHTKEQ